jgi:pyruvate/2-oxoglutarate dehydrogenase complex dihydrolipoamide dehydrogenase (E3) component
LGATQEELIHTVFPHPTLSEMMRVDAHDQAIHK